MPGGPYSACFVHNMVKGGILQFQLQILQCEKLQLTVEPFIVILADFLLRLGLRRASMKYLYECSPVKPLGSGGLNIQLLKCHSTPTCCTSMLLTAPAPSGLVKVWLLLGQHKEASAPFLQQGDPKPTIRFATR